MEKTEQIEKCKMKISDLKFRLHSKEHSNPQFGVIFIPQVKVKDNPEIWRGIDKMSDYYISPNKIGFWEYNKHSALSFIEKFKKDIEQSITNFGEINFQFEENGKEYYINLH